MSEHRQSHTPPPTTDQPTNQPRGVLAIEASPLGNQPAEVMSAIWFSPRGPRSLDDGVVETVYEVVGGAEGLLRLATAWHARVIADEVVSHAFSHGFHPRHTERLGTAQSLVDS